MWVALNHSIPLKNISSYLFSFADFIVIDLSYFGKHLIVLILILWA